MFRGRRRQCASPRAGALARPYAHSPAVRSVLSQVAPPHTVPMDSHEGPLIAAALERQVEAGPRQPKSQGRWPPCGAMRSSAWPPSSVRRGVAALYGTVSDGLIWLRQSVERNSMVRMMEIMKMRGQATIPGLHTFRISSAGIEVFAPAPQRHSRNRPRHHLHRRDRFRPNRTTSGAARKRASPITWSNPSTRTSSTRFLITR